MKKLFVSFLVLISATSLACNLSALQSKDKSDLSPNTKSSQSATEITQQLVTEMPQATIALFVATPKATQELTQAVTEQKTVEATTETSAETTQAPPAAKATPEPASECPKFGVEEFDNASPCWPSSLEEMKSITSLTSSPNEFAGIRNGALEFKHVVSDEVYLYAFNTANTYQEVAIEATFIKIDPSFNQNGATIACQVNDSGWYEVRVESSGSFYIYRYDASIKLKGGNPYIAIAQGGAPGVQSGAGKENTIRWTCKEDSLALAVNGKDIWNQEVRGMETGGGIGLGLASASGKYPLNIAFEKVEISEAR
ncbi:MAG: hypothetical protein BGO78_07105 [Chloroflexi bacterium 44-23]|nr:MAG: hypothetical protein BGO78_07105 [Chloroflexi bacterium 44-23]